LKASGNSNLPSSYLGPRRWHFYSIISSRRASSIGGLGAFIMIEKNLNSFGNALINDRGNRA